MWKYGEATKDELHIVCKVKVHGVECGERLKYKKDVNEKKGKSTSGFIRHLSKKHKIVIEKDEAGPLKQARLDGMGTWSSQSGRTKAVTSDLAKMIALDKLPAGMVDGVGFKAFMAKWLPQFPGVTAPTIASKLGDLANGFHAFFLRVFASVDGYSLTTDGWTSDAGHFYRCLTIHFFHSGWKIRRFVLWLGLCGRSAEEASAFVLQILKRFKLVASNCVAVTSDGCRVEIASLSLASLQRVSCVCHWLNLSLRIMYFEGAPASQY